MSIDLQMQIRSNPNLYRYLREYSYWYKKLNRNPLAIKEMEKEMKQRYKLTMEDKVNQISQGIEMIRTLIDVIR